MKKTRSCGWIPIITSVPLLNFILLSMPAFSTPTSHREFSAWSIYVDNDVLYPPYNEDRNYTNGLGVEFTSPWLAERRRLVAAVEFYDKLAAGLAPIKTTDAEGKNTHYSLLFGSTAFTPEDLDTQDPITADRPYSSLIFLSTKLQTVNKGEDFARTSEIMFGFLGLSVAREVQTFIHECITKDSPQPLGWDNQISDGGELTAFARTLGNKLLYPEPLKEQERNWLQMSFAYDLGLGYQTYVSIGPIARLGIIRSPFWGFDPAPFGPTTKRAPVEKLEMVDQPQQKAGDGGKAESQKEAQDRKKSTGKAKKRLLQEAYLFGSVKGTGVLYNVALQGQFRQSEVRFSGSEIERLVYEFSFGAAVRLKNTTVTYAVSGRGPEFKGPKARRHVWAGIYVSWFLARKDKYQSEHPQVPTLPVVAPQK